MLAYSLRFPARLKHSRVYKGDKPPDWQTDTIFRSDRYSIEYEDDKKSKGPLYQKEGFLAIQNTIASAFIAENSKYPVTIPEIRAQPFPSPAHTRNALTAMMSWIIPLFLMVSFNYTFMNTVRFIVNEKENQLKEAMRIMGLANWMHYLSWFIRSIVMLLIPVVVITIILKVTTINCSFYNQCIIIRISFFLFNNFRRRCLVQMRQFFPNPMHFAYSFFLPAMRSA